MALPRRRPMSYPYLPIKSQSCFKFSPPWKNEKKYISRKNKSPPRVSTDIPVIFPIVIRWRPAERSGLVQKRCMGRGSSGSRSNFPKRMKNTSINRLNQSINRLAAHDLTDSSTCLERRVSRPGATRGAAEVRTKNRPECRSTRSHEPTHPPTHTYIFTYTFTHSSYTGRASASQQAT